MRTIVFGPWVGEFSYEVQWWIPEIRQIASENDCKVVIVGYPGREALYRDFMHEYITLPPEVLSYCSNPNCWAQRRENSRVLYIPDEALGFYDAICSRYDDVSRHNPHEGLMSRRYLDTPYGIYKNLSEYDQSVQPIIDSILAGFDRKQTICIVPKLRKRDSINIDHETWPVEMWERVIETLSDTLNLNVVSFFFKVEDTTPGTHDLKHLETKFSNFRQIDLRCDKSLDIQIGLLKNSLCSLYGSTGAAVLPIMCNTKMITYQVKEHGWRLNFKWQRRLTAGHEFISIMDKYPASVYKNIGIGEVLEDITNYITKIRLHENN